jgi:hypothetical protein
MAYTFLCHSTNHHYLKIVVPPLTCKPMSAAMKMKSSSRSVRYATDAKDERTMEMMRDSDFQKRARRKMRRRRKVVRAPEKALVVLGTMSAWCIVMQVQQTAARCQEVLEDAPHVFVHGRRYAQ